MIAEENSLNPASVFFRFVSKNFSNPSLPSPATWGGVEILNIVLIKLLTLHDSQRIQLAFWNIGGGFEFYFFIY